MSQDCNVRSLVFRPFLITRHYCSNVVALSVDVTLQLRLCSEVVTLSCDVATLPLSAAV